MLTVPTLYNVERCALFCRTEDQHGALSNMAGGFPIEVGSTRFRTSEALYQACRFPHLPEVQEVIIDQRSPMAAKMRAKPHRLRSRPDWDQTRIEFMRWALRLKLAQNRHTFGADLEATGHKKIVELSRRDTFWGAKEHALGYVQGCNVLGKLLQELRELVRGDPTALDIVDPPQLPDVLILGRPAPSYVAPQARMF